jgi:hypothetical protein
MEITGRYFPKNCIIKEYPNFNNAIIGIQNFNNKIFIIAYQGKKRQHDFYYEIKENEIELCIQKFINNIKAWQDVKKERKVKYKSEAINFKNSLKIGTILYSSWGYDQTNIDFYQVITINGFKVTIKEIHKSKEYDNYGMSGKCKPLPNNFINDKIITCIIRNDYLRIGHQSASLWEGRELYFSEYA